MPDTPAKYRVQFDFAAEAYKELNELQEKLQAPTKAEVVRYAIRTLQWVVSTIEDGSTIIVKNNENLKEVVFPFMVTRGTPTEKKATSRELEAVS